MTAKKDADTDEIVQRLGRAIERFSAMLPANIARA
jgi:hypothetical protein